MSTLVRHAMTPAPQTARSDMTAADAAGLMRQFDVGVIPVVDDGELVGLVTDRDLVVRVMAKRENPMEVALGDIATRHPASVSPDMRLTEAEAMMADLRIRRLPVMKDDELVGILSLGDVAVAASSKRQVGQTLEQVSESLATTNVADGPARGTPERVRAAAREHERKG